MPHLTLEYTDNIQADINFEDLFSELHGVLVQFADIDINNCKSRAIKLDNYFISDGVNPDSFVHLSVRIFSGRSDELKKTIGEQLKNVLIDKFTNQSNKASPQITIEIQEINKEYYFKNP